MITRRLKRVQKYAIKHRRIIDGFDCPYDKKPCDSFIFIGDSNEEPYLRLCNVVSSFEKDNYIEKTVICYRSITKFLK